MRRDIIGKSPGDMANDEAMEWAAEHSAMDALNRYCATNLIDHMTGQDLIELRSRLEATIKECVERQIDVAKMMAQILP